MQGVTSNLKKEFYSNTHRFILELYFKGVLVFKEEIEYCQQVFRTPYDRVLEIEKLFKNFLKSQNIRLIEGVSPYLRDEEEFLKDIHGRFKTFIENQNLYEIVRLFKEGKKIYCKWNNTAQHYSVITKEHRISNNPIGENTHHSPTLSSRYYSFECEGVFWEGDVFLLSNLIDIPVR